MENNILMSCSVFWWRIAFLVYAAFATFFLLAPHPLQMLGLMQYSHSLSAGRGQHVAIFAGLTLCALLARWPRGRTALWGTLVAYAMATEAIQTFIPPRHGEWGDVAENLLGIAVGIVVYEGMRRLTRRGAETP